MAFHSTPQHGASWPQGMTFAVFLCLLALLLMTLLKRWVTFQPAEGESRKHGSSRDSILPLKQLDHFDWKSEQPRKFRPFKPIYNITMALQSDTPSDLITIDRDYLDRIGMRKSLISLHDRTVHGCIPQGEDSVQELYGYLLSEYLPTRYPTMFSLAKGKTLFQNHVTGDQHSVVPPRDAATALRVIGTTVEEDVFILKPTSKGHQCVAFMCCFPSGWDPSSKLGKHMNDIHTTVPSYEKIGPSMERFFCKLQTGKSVKRINWTVQTHADLFNAKGNHITEDYQEDPEESIKVDEAFVRCELQTLSRLPKSHSILFSFKTYLYPVREVKEEGMGPQLADAIEGLQKGNCPGMWKYKSAVRWGKPVCEYLRGL